MRKFWVKLRVPELRFLILTLYASECTEFQQRLKQFSRNVVMVFNGFRENYEANSEKVAL